MSRISYCCADIAPVDRGDDTSLPQRDATAETICQKQAARMFGVNFQTLKRWEREGLVPRSTLVGRRRLYPRDELTRIMAMHGRPGPSEPYPDPDRPGCWRLPLDGSEITRREAIIDAESVPLVRGRRWNFSRSDDSTQFVSLADPRSPTVLRRIIMGACGRDVRISHINGDPLDCRRENLLMRTMAEQAWGTRKMGTVSGREYTSRFKGVCFEQWSGKWVVQIRKDGKGRKIGRFSDEVEAAQAYDAAARELFGEHAYLNFPDGVAAWLNAKAARSARADAA